MFFFCETGEDIDSLLSALYFHRNEPLCRSCVDNGLWINIGLYEENTSSFSSLKIKQSRELSVKLTSDAIPEISIYFPIQFVCNQGLHSRVLLA